MMISRKTVAVPFLLVAAVALTAFAGAASATTLTSPKGSAYTGTIELESEGSTTFTSSFFVTVHCEEAKMAGKIEAHGEGKSAGGKLSSLSFTQCTDSSTARKPGSISIASNGTFAWSGAEWIVHTSVGECVYGTSNTELGTLTDSTATGGKATLDMPSASMPIIGGSFFCPSSSVWEGSFSVKTPSTLYID